MATTTLTQRAIEAATEKREQAWQRLCRAESESSRRHWRAEYDRLAALVIRMERRVG